MKLFIRIVVFYCCISLFSGDLVSLALKVKETCAFDIEKEKSEESKEDCNKEEAEEKYNQHEYFSTIAQFNYIIQNKHNIHSEKLISQIHKEITTPPPNC